MAMAAKSMPARDTGDAHYNEGCIPDVGEHELAALLTGVTLSTVSAPVRFATTWKVVLLVSPDKSTKYPTVAVRSTRIVHDKDCRVARMYPNRVAQVHIIIPGNAHIRQYEAIKHVIKRGFDLKIGHFEFLHGKYGDLESSYYFLTRGPTLLPITIEDVVRWHIPANPWNSRMTLVRQAARLDLMFSDSVRAAVVTWDGRHPSSTCSAIVHCTTTPDVISELGTCMTDGCGFMSPLMAEIARTALGQRDRPVAVQGRLGGFKGVWLVNPFLEGYVLQLRTSMKKIEYDISEDPALEHSGWEVMKCNGNHGPGGLNHQITSLLLALGLSTDTLLRMQNEALESFASVVGQGKARSRDCLQYLRTDGSEGMVRAALELGFDDDSYVARCVQQCLERKLDDIAAHGHIPVACSRRLMMVPDPTGLLEPGEVFIQLQEDRAVHTAYEDMRAEHAYASQQFHLRTQTTAVLSGNVVLARNPCHHPDHIAMMQAVDIADKADASTLAQCKRWKACLYNVVVFSTKGIVSDAQLLSGGDFDGDVAWVCWDARIVDIVAANKQHCPTYAHPAESDTERAVFASLADVYEYSLRDFSLGQATNLHLAWLDYYLDPATTPVDPFEKGREPGLLASLCGEIVDARKTGRFCRIPAELQRIAYPHFMRQARGSSRKSTSALGRMFDEGVALALHYRQGNLALLAEHLPAACSSKLLRTVANKLNWWTVETLAEQHYQHFQRHKDRKSSRLRFCQTFEAREDKARLAMAYYIISWNHVFVGTADGNLSTFPWDIACQEIVDAVQFHAAWS